MAHKSCKSQIAVLEMNGQSVPQRWTKISYMRTHNVQTSQANMPDSALCIVKPVLVTALNRHTVLV